MNDKPPISFEIESYVFRQGRPYILSEREEQDFWEESEDYGKFHPVMRFMIEGKTAIITSDVEVAARNAISNLNKGLDTLKRITRKMDLVLRCDSTLYDSLVEVPREDREEAGTHVHVDFSSLAEHLDKTCQGLPITELIVWRMRQRLPHFIERYCYSERLTRKLSDPREPDFIHLGVLPDGTYRQTISFRGNTIELVSSDSTQNLDTLVALGRDYQECAVEAVNFIQKNPGFGYPSDLNERKKIMRGLLDGHYNRSLIMQGIRNR